MSQNLVGEHAGRVLSGEAALDPGRFEAPVGRPAGGPGSPLRPGRQMTREQAEAAADRLEESFGRYAPHFGKPEARRHALNYLKGLMACPDRKSIEPIAMTFGGGRVSGLQKFINIAPWKTGEVGRQMQAAFVERFRAVPGPGSAGTFGVISFNAFTKKGSSSVGVERQTNPRTGRTENCQLGVFLHGVAAGGVVLLGEQLYLPRSWSQQDPASEARRVKVHVPKGLAYHSRTQAAAELLRRHSVRSLLRLDWVTTTGTIADPAELTPLIEQSFVPIVAGVPLSLRFRVDPSQAGPAGEGGPSSAVPVSAMDLSAALRPSAWHEAGRSAGAIRECAAVRARYVVGASLGPPVWLLVERLSTPQHSVTSAYVSNAGFLPCPEVLADAAEARAKADRFFDESVSLLGMRQYETRSWIGWHHHMTLVGLAHLLVTLGRADAVSAG